MNEIQKKRIEGAEGESSFKYLSQDGIEELELECHYNAGFIEGAEYALSHQWISVEDAMPEANENVLALIGGVPVVAKGYHVRARLRDITHWLPIPKFEPNKTE